MRRQVALITTMITTGFAMGHDFPAFEEYAKQDNLGAYPKAALEYIGDNPSSIWSPRLALDLLVVGELAKGDTLTARSREILCFRYPESPQARYVLTTFEDAKEFRKFVQPNIERISTSLSAGDCQNTCKLLRAAVVCFGDDLFGDVDFALQAYALAKTTGDAMLATVIQQKQLSKIDDESQRHELAQLCMDTAVTSEERVLQLGSMPQDGLTRRIKRLYLGQLSEAARGTSPIILVSAHEAALDKQFEEALQLLAQLPTSTSPKLETQLLRAYCQFAVGNDVAAIKLLEKTEGSDDLAQYARDYCAGIAQLSSRKSAMAEAIKTLVESLLGEPLTAFEASASFSPKDGVPLSIYIGIQPDRSTVELHVRRNDERLFAYRTTANTSQLLFGQDERILSFTGAGPIPVPSLELERTEEGGFKIEGGAKMTTSMEAAAKAGTGITESPYLTTLSGLEELLDHGARRSMLPAEPRREGSQTTWSLFGRSLATGELRQLEITSDGTDKLTAIRFNDTLEITDIRYSVEPGTSLTPPLWPDVQIEKRDAIGMPEMMRAMQLLFSVMGK